MRSSGIQVQLGYTLLEMMIAVIIAAIVLVIAVPNVRQMMDSNKLTGTTNNVVAALSLARQQAITNHRGSSLCVSSDGETCTGEEDWATGWIAYSDLDDDGPDLTEISRVQEPISGLTIRVNIYVPAYSQVSAVNYDASATVGKTHEFYIRPVTCVGNNQRVLRLLSGGMVRNMSNLTAC